MTRILIPLILALAATAVQTGCSDSAPTAKAKNSAALQKRAQTVVPSAVFDAVKLNDLTNVDLAWGGLIYDKFWATDSDGTLPAPPASLPADPAGGVVTNVSWPATNVTQKGVNTWRCVACHGWDYVGAAGQFSDPNSPFYTGISGVITSVAGSPKTLGNSAAIFDVIDTGTLNGVQIPGHDFGQYLPSEEALYALTYFVTMMQSEATANSDPQKKIADIKNADQLNGYKFYNFPGAPSQDNTYVSQGGCGASCHGDDGTGVVIHADKPTDPKDVKTFANKEPFEVLHKLRFGHLTSVTSTNAKMPGLEWYPTPEILTEGALKVAVDVLAYSQSGLMPDWVRGGRLYDNWVLETKVAAPAGGLQPLMKIRSTQPGLPDIPPQNEWLCSSCHGFDYKGGLGFQNNLLELRARLGREVPDYYFRFLSKGRNAWLPVTHEKVSVHSYGPLLAEADLWDIGAFLRTGMDNTGAYLSVGLNGTALGNAAAGSAYASTEMPDLIAGPVDAAGVEIMRVCTGCHGDDGMTGTANVNLPHIAWDAPWRFFHRVRFGMPGTFAGGTPETTGRMPGLNELVLSSPLDPTLPMIGTELTSTMKQRAADIQTFAQEMYVQAAPANVAALKIKTALTLKAGVGQ